MPSAEFNPVVVHLEGELDLEAVQTVVHELATAAKLSEDVVIDLRDVTFIDSNGVGVLAHAVRGGATLAVTDAPPHVQRVIQLTGLTGPIR
jgi:anti-anti-sigma factor